MKSFTLDITPCNPLKINRRLGGICHLYLLGRAFVCHLLSRYFLAWLILRPWRWRRRVPPKRRLNFKTIHSVISKNTELFRFLILTILSPGMCCCMVRWLVFFKKMLIICHGHFIKISNYRLGTTVDNHLKIWKSAFSVAYENPLSSEFCNLETMNDM
jgi:hypothetical protein